MPVPMAAATRLPSDARSSNTARAEPSSKSSLAAIFGPMPRTPGRLSDGSPRSAARSRYCAGRMPSMVTSRSAVSIGEASTPPLMIRNTRVCSSISGKASRSEVMITVVHHGGCVPAAEASTSSASSPSGTTTASPSSRSHLGRPGAGDQGVQLARGWPCTAASGPAGRCGPDRRNPPRWRPARSARRLPPVGSAVRAPPTSAGRPATAVRCWPESGSCDAPANCHRWQAEPGSSPHYCAASLRQIPDPHGVCRSTGRWAAGFRRNHGRGSGQSDRRSEDAPAGGGGESVPAGTSFRTNPQRHHRAPSGHAHRQRDRQPPSHPLQFDRRPSAAGARKASPRGRHSGQNLESNHRAPSRPRSPLCDRQSLVRQRNAGRQPLEPGKRPRGDVIPDKPKSRHRTATTSAPTGPISPTLKPAGPR